MVTGVYRLSFKGTDSVYIGQSVDIYRRFANHLRRMVAGTSSKKLQKAYNTYGTPVLDIICECSKELLDITELEAFSIFNCIDEGFNTIEIPGAYYGLYGELHGQSMHTNEKYTEVFLLLVENILTKIEISELTNVSIHIVDGISNLSRHVWLKDLYPEEYSILISLKENKNYSDIKTASKIGTKYPKIKSPEGVIYEITCLKEFCSIFGFSACSFGRFIRGQTPRNSYKGWTIHEGEYSTRRPEKSECTVISPEGTAHVLRYGEKSEFARAHGLHQSELNKLCSGKIKKTLGWTLLT